MPNLLDFPFKKTYEINIDDPVRDFISRYCGGHPEEFKHDIQTWQDLRRNGTGGVVHVDRIEAMVLYHAQLAYILSKLPSDMQLEIPYAPVFRAQAIPISLKSLVFERAVVLFNLASLYSQLASLEDRSDMKGIKRAASYYQHAAGTLSYLTNAVIPKLVYAPDDEERPLDLSPGFIKGLEALMLAQAQECSWQIAKLNDYKSSLIAKIAARVGTLYTLSAQAFRDADPPVRHLLPSDWLPHIEAKSHHFIAVSEYRKSIEEIESSRYGWEISRLKKAQDEAKKAYDFGRRGKIAASVLEDTQSLIGTLDKSISRAERDNNLIYHHDIPAAAALPPIPQTNLVNPNIPSGLLEPKTALGDMSPLFAELIGWGAREAINIYNERKQILLKEKIVDAVQELQYQANNELRSMNLPASLEALERPIGLPPSLLQKAEEVRLENGLAWIEASIDDVRRLAQHDQNILDEAMDILDGEASEDEAARREISLTRLPSYEANAELIAKEKRYRSILQEAATGDETIRQKWDEWEDSISQLTWDEAVLETSIPSSTVTTSSHTTPQSIETRSHARTLRAKLEALDKLHHESNQLVHQARILEQADDIQRQVLNVASTFRSQDDLRPEMFEDILDQEIAKYDNFLRAISELRQRQSEILVEIKAVNDQFLRSRREDPSVREREHALQSLDLAYFKYRELRRNLEEGFKFYNDLASILMQFKEACRTWTHQRRQEIHALHLEKPFAMLSLTDDSGASQEATLRSPPQSTSVAPARAQTSGNRFGDIPQSFHKEDWGFEDVKLPPGPKRH